MAQKYPGFYLYYDWLDALENMNPDRAMTILKNLRNYAQHDIDPPELGGWESFIQNFMLAQLKRSKSISQSCRAQQKRRAELLHHASAEECDLSTLPDDVRRIQEAIRRGMARDDIKAPHNNQQDIRSSDGISSR